MSLPLSVIVPAYREGPWIRENIIRLSRAISISHEILIVVDYPDDPTIAHLTKLELLVPQMRLEINSLGPGPANAIRYGLHVSKGDVRVVFMADGCDDFDQVEELYKLVSRGVAIAAASRYAPSGQQVGGPRFKRFLSKLAGKSLHMIAGVGTRDATNSFKAYSKEFLSSVQIESRDGFEIGIELVSKAHRMGYPIAEIPTTWIDRSARASHFRLLTWIPKYLRWYLFCAMPTLKRKDKVN